MVTPGGATAAIPQRSHEHRWELSRRAYTTLNFLLGDADPLNPPTAY